MTAETATPVTNETSPASPPTLEHMRENYNAFSRGTALGFPTVAEGLRTQGRFLHSFAAVLEQEGTRTKTGNVETSDMHHIEQIITNPDFSILPPQDLDALQENFGIGSSRRQDRQKAQWKDEVQTILKMVQREHGNVALRHKAETEAGKRLDEIASEQPDLLPSDEALKSLEEHKVNEATIQQTAIHFLRDAARKNPADNAELLELFKQQKEMGSAIRDLLTGEVRASSIKALLQQMNGSPAVQTALRDASLLAAVGKKGDAATKLEAVATSIAEPGFLWGQLVEKGLLSQEFLHNLDQVKLLSDLVETSRCLSGEPKSVQARYLTPFLQKEVSATLLTQMLDGDMHLPQDFLVQQIDAFLHFHDEYQQQDKSVSRKKMLVSTALLGMATMWVLNSPAGQPLKDTAQEVYEQAKTALVGKNAEEAASPSPTQTPSPTDEAVQPTAEAAAQASTVTRPSALTRSDTTGRQNVGPMIHSEIGRQGIDTSAQLNVGEATTPIPSNSGIVNSGTGSGGASGTETGDDSGNGNGEIGNQASEAATTEDSQNENAGEGQEGSGIGDADGGFGSNDSSGQDATGNSAEAATNNFSGENGGSNNGSGDETGDGSGLGGASFTEQPSEEGSGFGGSGTGAGEGVGATGNESTGNTGAENTENGEGTQSGAGGIENTSSPEEESGFEKPATRDDSPSENHKPENSSKEESEQAEKEIYWEISGKDKEGYYRIDSASDFTEGLSWESNRGDYHTPTSINLTTERTLEGERKISGQFYEVPVPYGFILSKDGVTVVGDDVSWELLQSADGNLVIKFAEEDLGKDVTIAVHLAKPYPDFQETITIPPPTQQELAEMSEPIVDVSVLPEEVQDFIADLQSNNELTLEEKAQKLASYIQNEFTYSLDQEVNTYYAGAGSNKSEYIRRVFDEKKTDCDVANTALVALLRANGIPARMAYGFLNIDEHSFKNDDKLAGNEMHGWAEAFIPNGKGGTWLKLDGTPPSTENPSLDFNIKNLLNPDQYVAVAEWVWRMEKDPNLFNWEADIVKYVTLVLLLNPTAGIAARKIRRGVNEELERFRDEFGKRHEIFFKRPYKRTGNNRSTILDDEIESIAALPPERSKMILAALFPGGSYLPLVRRMRERNNLKERVPYDDAPAIEDIRPAEEPRVVDFFTEALGYDEAAVVLYLQEKVYKETRQALNAQIRNDITETIGYDFKDNGLENMISKTLASPVGNGSDYTAEDMQRELEARITGLYTEYQKKYDREKQVYEKKYRKKDPTRREYRPQASFDEFGDLCTRTHRTITMLKLMRREYQAAKRMSGAENLPKPMAANQDD